MSKNVCDGFYVIACDLKQRIEMQEGKRFDSAKEAQKYLRDKVKKIKGIIYAVYEYKNNEWISYFAEEA